MPAVRTPSAGVHPLRKTRVRVAAWLAVVVFASAGNVRAADDFDAQQEQAIQQAAALAAPSMVRIETVGGLDQVAGQLTSAGPTTGVIVSPDGYIVSSSFNFISKPASILVTLPDGRRLPAEQVATDKLKMLTLLKVQAEGLTPAVAAPADTFRVGQWALALGKTYDSLLPNVSMGIVSALNRVWGKAIQTDAKVSPVNYGGPLLDIEGRTLGVIVPLSPTSQGEMAGVEWYDGGIGFAIPLVDVLATLDRLKQGKDLLPGHIGIAVKGADLYAPDPTVDRVRYGSPAYNAGIKEKDVILELDGKPVERIAQIQQVLGTKYADDKVAIVVRRGTEKISAEMTLVGQLLPYESPWLGMLPARLSQAETDEKKGVAVRLPIENGPAAKAGLARNDRIVEFQGTAITDSTQLSGLVSRSRPGDTVKLAVVSNEQRREVEVTLGTIPVTVPAELRSVVIPTQDPKPAADAGPKRGHFTGTLEAFEHDYWAIVPDDYNPQYQYALLVWLHPPGDTLEGTVRSTWTRLCNERGIILIAPKAKQIAGWNPDEAEFIRGLTEEFRKLYNIDARRVVISGFAASGNMAYHVAFKFRDQYRGLVAMSAPLSQPPTDNEPDFRLQFYLACGENEGNVEVVKKSVLFLRAMKYPVVEKLIENGERKYPATSVHEEISRWIDMLDQI